MIESRPIDIYQTTPTAVVAPEPIQTNQEVQIINNDPWMAIHEKAFNEFLKTFSVNVTNGFLFVYDEAGRFLRAISLQKINGFALCQMQLKTMTRTAVQLMVEGEPEGYTIYCGNEPEKFKAITTQIISAMRGE